MRQRSQNIQWTTSSSIKMTQQQLSMVHKWNDYADTDQRHQCLQHTSTHAYCSARQSWTPHDFCGAPIRVELHLHNAHIATASLRNSANARFWKLDARYHVRTQRIQECFLTDQHAANLRWTIPSKRSHRCSRICSTLVVTNLYDEHIHCN